MDAYKRYAYFYATYDKGIVLKCQGQYFRVKYGSEAFESINTQQYALENGFLAYPIFNELSLGNAFRLLAHRAAMGLKKGIPDLFMIAPPTQEGYREAFFIEMKKARGKRGGMNGSKIQPEQAEFNELVKACGIHSFICHGFEEAKQILDSYLQTGNTSQK